MKSVVFKQSWREAVAQFPVGVRREIYAATMFYALENSVPSEMSDLARGAFAFIKADMDAARARAEKSAMKRKGSGASVQAGGESGGCHAHENVQADREDQPVGEIVPAEEADSIGEESCTARLQPPVPRLKKSLDRPGNARPRRKTLAAAIDRRLRNVRRA
ncbi:MAG: hypothetical protein K2F79_01310 [Muribaculaceae bacterium]|nr:hypothetical protein [Muribaculaceae bacterium]